MLKTLSSRIDPEVEQTRDSLTPAQVALYDKEIEMVARELRLWLPDDERRAIRRTPKTDLALFHSTLGRAIRNEYDLWLEEHHITKIWHEANVKFPLTAEGPTSIEMDASDGRTVVVSSNAPIIFDNHPCHPDAFSMRCIERLWELLQSKGTV